MFLICSYFLPVSASFFYRLSCYKKRVKITSAVLDQLQVWNRIKDEVIKIGLKKNLLRCKKKSETREKSTKKPRKKTIRPETHLNFQYILNFKRCWGIETSGKFRSSNILELINKKLKQTVTMIRLRLTKKGTIEKLGKTCGS